MRKNKVWKIKGFEGQFSDEEVVTLIKRGELKPDYSLSTKEMKKWVKLKDSIYQYYLEDDENATL